jgi:hypothetical protein
MDVQLRFLQVFSRCKQERNVKRCKPRQYLATVILTTFVPSTAAHIIGAQPEYPDGCRADGRHNELSEGHSEVPRAEIRT